MHYYKNIYCVILFFIYSNSFSASFDRLQDIQTDMYKEMQEHFAKISQDLEQMHHDIQSIQEKENSFIEAPQHPELTIDNSKAEKLIVMVDNVQSPVIESTKHYDAQDTLFQIDIQAGNTIIKLSYNQTTGYFGSELTYQAYKENKQEKSGMQQILYKKTENHGTTVTQDLDLEHATIEYNKQEQTVTITIPKKRTTRSMQNMRQTQENMEQEQEEEEEIR